MKLIDILNKIANGDLKEGTKVIWDFKEYLYDGRDSLWRITEYNSGSRDIFEDICLGNLVEEVELNDFGKADKMAKHNHFADDGKMAEPTDNTKIKELIDWKLLIDGTPNEELIQILWNKLNEVINKVNAQTTVVLSHEKDIEEIKSDLDY